MQKWDSNDDTDMSEMFSDCLLLLCFPKIQENSNKHRKLSQSKKSFSDSNDSMNSENFESDENEENDNDINHNEVNNSN